MRKDGISVIVCCYNSSQRIEPTLQHLFQQETDQDLDWEIIVVDNNSTDDTAQKATALHQRSGASIPFRVVYEPAPGLSNARQAGFAASRFSICLMVDDDNWLSPNYVQGVFSAFAEDDRIGMVGGLGIPQLSSPAPDWFARYAYCFATGPQTPDGKPGDALDLYGAGLALRLSVLDKLKANGFQSLLTDRVGSSLMSGGDTELCFAFRMAGYRLVYRPLISFKHELPGNRINWTYLRRLFHGFGLTKSRMDIYTACMANKPIPSDGRLPFWFNRAAYLGQNLLPHLRLLIKSRFSSMEGNDQLLVALAKAGQIQGIISMRKNYIDHYQQVYRLKQRLSE